MGTPRRVNKGKRMIPPPPTTAEYTLTTALERRRNTKRTRVCMSIVYRLPSASITVGKRKWLLFIWNM
jgi:hypothetical protein